MTENGSRGFLWMRSVSIEIDKQHALPKISQRGAKINGQSGFPDSALLVTDRNELCHASDTSYMWVVSHTSYISYKTSTVLSMGKMSEEVSPLYMISKQGYISWDMPTSPARMPVTGSRLASPRGPLPLSPHSLVLFLALRRPVGRAAPYCCSIEEQPAGQNLPNRAHQLLVGTILEQIASRTGLLGLGEIYWVLGDGEEQNVGRRAGLANEAGCHQAIHHGHPDIHEHEIRLEVATEREGFLAIGRFPDDRQVRFDGQQRQEASTNQDMIVHNDQSSGWDMGEGWLVSVHGRTSWRLNDVSDVRQ
jgi:hypothetical protein